MRQVSYALYSLSSPAIIILKSVISPRITGEKKILGTDRSAKGRACALHAADLSSERSKL